MFETARAFVSSGAPFNLDSLSFAKFNWLMAQEQVASLAEWTESLLDGLDAAALAMVEPALVALEESEGSCQGESQGCEFRCTSAGFGG